MKSKNLCSLLVAVVIMFGLPVLAQEEPEQPAKDAKETKADEQAKKEEAKKKKEEASGEDQKTQDEARKDDGRFVRYFLEFGYYFGQAAGVDFVPATLTTGSSSVALAMDIPQQSNVLVRGGLVFKDNIGELILTYWSQDNHAIESAYTPGHFAFGETLVPPTYAGFANDGLADGYDATSRALTRDIRLDFYRQAFSSPRMSGRWYIGVRRLDRDNEIGANYYGLDAPLPAFLPPLTAPRPDLQPIPDGAEIVSQFSGNGLEAGFELRIPVTKRIWIDSGLGFALLQGSQLLSYAATTHAYALFSSDGSTIERILQPPYSEFEQLQDPNDPSQGYLIDSIRQVPFPVTWVHAGSETTVQVTELFAAARARAWKDLEVFLGLRATRYDNTNSDMIPSEAATKGLPKVDRTVSYYGLNIGLSYKF
jgi:hypothetical protein